LKGAGISGCIAFWRRSISIISNQSLGMRMYSLSAKIGHLASAPKIKKFKNSLFISYFHIFLTFSLDASITLTIFTP
jgi:hypothetical protein